jgi:ABC-type branched-subunit amino acid transport system substrate-binding protein
MKPVSKAGIVILAALLLLLPLLAACSSDSDDEKTPPDGTQEPQKDVVITLGNITDLTGAGARAMSIVNAGLEDAVRYFNEQGFIPGVEVKIIKYDSQYDPSREIPGYKFLKSKGADIIVGNMPQTAITLKPFVNDDEMLLFALPYTEVGFMPPGYTFSLNVPTQSFGPTMLKWIAENDPDFPQDRPARIGAVNWDEPQSRSVFEGVKKYVKAHPDKFEWEGMHLTGRTFTWGPEVDDLKDCDYLFPPMAGLASFANEYRKAGYTAKFVGTDGQAAFMGLVDQARLWDELDGMFFGLPYGYWTDDTGMINLVNQYVREYRDDADDIIENGTSYLGPFIAFQGMLSILAQAATEVGAQNLTSQVIYDTAQSFSMEFDGRQWGYSETKRNAVDSLGIYELSAAEEDLFRADPEWLTLVDPE